MDLPGIRAVIAINTTFEISHQSAALDALAQNRPSINCLRVSGRISSEGISTRRWLSPTPALAPGKSVANKAITDEKTGAVEGSSREEVRVSNTTKMQTPSA